MQAVCVGGSRRAGRGPRRPTVASPARADLIRFASVHPRAGLMHETLPPLHGLDESLALRSIVEGTATHTGDRFFQTLVESLARVLGTHGAWVTEYLPEVRRLRALAFWLGGEWIQGFEHPIDGTPCAEVVEGRRLVHIAAN